MINDSYTKDYEKCTKYKRHTYKCRQDITEELTLNNLLRREDSRLFQTMTDTKCLQQIGNARVVFQANSKLPLQNSIKTAVVAPDCCRSPVLDTF